MGLFSPISLRFAGDSASQDKFEAFKAKRKSDIMNHEQAHKAAAGGLGGQIHIDYDANGVAVGGHVPISLPGLDTGNPERSKALAQKVKSAAMAPADPSGQDYSVASKALAIMGQAQVLLDQKNNNQQKK